MPATAAPNVSYWQASTPPFAGAQAEPVAGTFDVCVIGAGFTGLSAALALARQGVRVAVLEAGKVLGAASGRNGGQCNAGTAHDFSSLVAAHGLDQARAWYLAHCDAVDTVERIAREEAIDCDFRRVGRAKLAAKPEHFPKLEAAWKILVRDVDPNVALVPPERIGDEVGSSQFHGALIQLTSAQLHVGRFGIGMANRVTEAGGAIWEHAPVTEIKRNGTLSPRAVRAPENPSAGSAVALSRSAASPSPLRRLTRRPSRRCFRPGAIM